MSLLTSLFNGGSVKATPKQKPQKQAPPPCPVPLPTGSVPVIPARIPGPVVPGSTPGYRPPSVRPSSVTPDPLMPVSVEPVLNNETKQTIYNAPTEVLLAQPPYRVVAMPETIETPPPAPKKTKANVRKVTVRTSAPAKPNAEMDELIAKLTALDPDSQQLVRDLIERLSK